jgi:FAD/FMN-containing dehydrogenase/Fe-S oxidoreductase
MLQEITIESIPPPEIKRFLSDLNSSGFRGDISTTLASRVVASSDNSIWQETPEVVITPHSHFCVERILETLNTTSHHNIAITPRGGGTSTSGQTLTNSIVLDCKRYLHSILEYNDETKQVHVQCGAVLDEVNKALVEFGVKIGPTVATSSRATIGGMIGNDSAGKGSSVYGKMSDCVVELHTVLRGGTQLNDHPNLTKTIKDACDRARPHFAEFWPSLPRFATGYNLPMAWDGHTFDVNRILCGSEGTLGIITSAVLQCVDLPMQQELVLLCFDSFEEALKCGIDLRQFRPSAIETVDEMVIQAARNNRGWNSISEFLGTARDDVKAILFVEFTNKYVTNGKDAIAFAQSKYSFVYSSLLTNKEDICVAWEFRSRSVGLLSSVEGRKTPIPFVEDCAVPPESLASFICDFKNILNENGVSAGMFGHVDAGVIHVRPALDMKNADDRSLVKSVTEQVATLVQSYGGILWGEHGKGFRSEFGPIVFGDVIWEQMCVIKHAFDPNNQLNPGKVAPTEVTGTLYSINHKTRGELDETIASLPILSTASRCDGNSECESASFESAMCPTYRATGDPIHSPRGRANLIRHWLQHVGKSPSSPRGSLLNRIANSGNHTDFSHEVREALDGCLSCKACASDCPMQIDIPSMRAEFYHAYFGRYLRPLRDHVWFNMERMLPLFASRLGQCIPTTLLGSLVGIVDTPKVISRKHQHFTSCTPKDAIAQHASVVLVQDSFTTFFRPHVMRACIRLMTFLGHNVSVLEYKPSGKALHVRGNLSTFKTIAQRNTDWLRPLQDAEIPLIGIDPATTLLWRDEYPKSIDSHEQIQVLLPQEWLISQNLEQLHIEGTWKLFPHCIERASASKSQSQWRDIFHLLGATLDVIETACCGMGGLFGHQREYRNQSLTIWEQHWKPHNPDSSDSLTTGYSCYSQAKRVSNIFLQHPIEIITNAIPSQ